MVVKRSDVKKFSINFSIMLKTKKCTQKLHCLLVIRKYEHFHKISGDTRALFCQTDEGGVFKVAQLSVDHSIFNEEELNRLSQLGLDVERLKLHRRIGSSDSTRCIGDYHVKGGYMDIEILQWVVYFNDKMHFWWSMHYMKVATLQKKIHNAAYGNLN